MDGLISVLRHGFKHRGIPFKVCYFKPESGLNQTAMSLYEENEITCNRQWFYSNDTHNSVDMVLAVNGIPVFALELKNQYTGQNVDHAKRQWMYDRDPREICFQFNKRILGYFCIDQLEVWMTTKLEEKIHIFYRSIRDQMVPERMAEREIRQTRMAIRRRTSGSMYFRKIV